MGFAIGVEFENVTLGKKRIANRISAPANKAMMIILIIARNVLCGVPTVFDTHWLDSP